MTITIKRLELGVNHQVDQTAVIEKALEKLNATVIVSGSTLTQAKFRATADKAAIEAALKPFCTNTFWYNEVQS